MTLNERAAELSERLTYYAVAKAGSNNISRLTTRSTQITEDALLLRKAVHSVSVLRSIGAMPKWDSSYVQRLHESTGELERQIELSPIYLLKSEGESACRDQRRFVQDFTQKLNTACAEAWTEFVQRERPALDLGLLSTLSQVALMAPLVAGIRADLSYLENSGRVVPNTNEEATTFLETCRSVRRSWDELVGSGLSDEVESFFRALSLGTVPFSLLTDQVHLWINEKGLSGSFYVTTRPTR